MFVVTKSNSIDSDRQTRPLIGSNEPPQVFSPRGVFFLGIFQMKSPEQGISLFSGLSTWKPSKKKTPEKIEAKKKFPAIRQMV